MSARLDVVTNYGDTANPMASPSAAAAAQQSLIVGSEPGLVARALMTSSFTAHPFTVDLAPLNNALGIVQSSTPSANPVAGVTQVRVANRTRASTYTVYLITTYNAQSCPKGTVDSSQTGTAVEDIAHLVP